MMHRHFLEEAYEPALNGHRSLPTAMVERGSPCGGDAFVGLVPW